MAAMSTEEKQALATINTERLAKLQEAMRKHRANVSDEYRRFLQECAAIEAVHIQQMSEITA